ncbi:uncharacterized protein [Panulirus ornatus]|uniref:uncharacterized protein n=1 Tax=Panulirus ornatus TaxID=150431 RepID=UPI003A8ABD60
MIGGRITKRSAKNDKDGEGGGGGRESPEIDRYVEDLFFNMINPASNKVSPAKARKPQKDDVYVIPTVDDGEEQRRPTPAPLESPSPDPSAQFHPPTLRESTPYPRQRVTSSSTFRKSPSPDHRIPTPSPPREPPLTTTQLATLSVKKLKEELPKATVKGLVVEPLMPMASAQGIFNNTDAYKTALLLNKADCFQ